MYHFHVVTSPTVSLGTFASPFPRTLNVLPLSLDAAAGHLQFTTLPLTDKSKCTTANSNTAMASNISSAAVRAILGLLFLLASFTRPDIFWAGLLGFIFILILPSSLAIYITGLLALEFLSAWAADPACEPAERRVLRTLYWGALPGMLAHSVARIVVHRRGRAGWTVPLFWASGVAVACGTFHAWREEELGREEWEYLHHALWLWEGRLMRWIGACVFP